jgi:hypothetical protein
MWRSKVSCCALVLLAFAPAATGQTYEELKKENERLRARIKELEAAKHPEGVVVSYDHPTGKLVVKIGAAERAIALAPRAHVHDPEGFEVRGTDRIEKLKPGVRLEIVEKEGKLEEINIIGADGRRHGHRHDADGEWKWVDPYYPGWQLPSDDYRPNSWMAPPSEGFCRDLLHGQFVDTHRSTGGTPWSHPFTIEPAQLHRDFFFFYKLTKNAEGTSEDEHEAELHIDWGLTRRAGILLAVPYLGLAAPDEHQTGFGDIEVAPRIVFIESETFYLSTNIFMTIPTGSEARGLGNGEMTLAPFLTTWHDLGSCRAPWANWNQLHVNVGPEFGLQSGDASLLYTAAYGHSFLGPKVLLPHHHGNGNGHGHNGGHQHAQDGGTISPIGPGYPPGLITLALEFNGQTELQGDRFTNLQLLGGISYVLAESAEIRFGVNIPLNDRERQLEAQYILGFSWMY